MSNAIREKLRRLYGEQVGEQTYAGMGDLLTPVQSGDVGSLAVDKHDVMLICYGDHVQDGDTPPLAVMQRFLKERVHPTINSVHFLPFYPWTSDDGFSVVDYYRVDDALGDWEHIRSMTGDFRLMFDAVFNHISSQSEWFQKYLAGEAPYDGYFIDVPPETDLSAVVRPRALPLLSPYETANGTRHVWTTFSPDQVDLNVENPAVLIELLKVLRFYVEQGMAFVRLDAIAFLWKAIGTTSIHLEQTHLIIQMMRDYLDVIAPDVIIITETNVPHEENISYFGDGTNEAQLVYQFPLPPLVLHTMAAGDTTHLTRWAGSLAPAGDRTTFFNFTASHDGIGLRPVTGLLSDDEVQALVQRTEAHGGQVSYKNNSDGSQSPYEMNITYFDAITDPQVTAQTPDVAVKRFIVAQAIALSLAGVPGIYFSSLFGGRNWTAGVAQTGRARTINRRKYDYSTLTADLTGDTLRQQVFTAMMALLEQRRNTPACHPLAAQTVLDVGPSVFAVLRQTGDGEHGLLALHNVTGQPVTVTVPADVVNRYAWDAGERSLDGLTLLPYEVLWINGTAG
ncbi:MAG: sugar phosphorylase [Chloroflexota bacterium]